MKITIGTNIKRLRSDNGITQEQLAEAMNVTCAAVSKWERGETYPDISMLQPLAFYFGVSLDVLMGYDKEKVNEDALTPKSSPNSPCVSLCSLRYFNINSPMQILFFILLFYISHDHESSYRTRSFHAESYRNPRDSSG